MLLIKILVLLLIFTFITQIRNNNDYAKEIKKLESDQTISGSGTLNWGTDGKNGYFKFDYTYTATYHYKPDTDQIVVTSINFHLSREEPTQKGGGFWDAIIIANPNANLPQETGDFAYPNGDIPGVTGDSLWSKYGLNKKDVFAFTAQNNKSEEYSIHYNDSGIVPYTVNRNSDGTFTIFKTLMRGNTNDDTHHNWHIQWRNGNLKKNIEVPMRKSSEIHYHFDVNINCS